MTAFDMTESIIPRSDQLNADDLMTGPRTVTVADVKHGSSEQPVDIVTAEFGPERPYKPSKSMRRVLVAAWGKDAAAYVGRRITIYRDPEVKFGADKVGGIRISHLSHINTRLSLALTVTRGRRAPFVVEPLPDEQQRQLIDADAVAEFERDIANAETLARLDELADDLKAYELGAHKGHLQKAWSDRRVVIKESGTQDALPAQEQDNPKEGK